MFRKIRNIEFKHGYEAKPIPIIGHAAMTMPEVGGILAPVLIIDTTERPDIEEYVKLHGVVLSGDVKTQWGRKPENTSIYQLVLEVIRPAELLLYFELPFPKYISVIDHIAMTECVCIQPGRPGDKLSQTFVGTPRVVMEVPEMGFRQRWDKRLHKYYEKKFRRDGMRKRNAEEAASTFIAERRLLMTYRMQDA